MDRSKLLSGLNQNSSVSERMLAELTRAYSELVQLSCANQNWTERDQADFELLHTIIRRNRAAKRRNLTGPARKCWETQPCMTESPQGTAQNA